MANESSTTRKTPTSLADAANFDGAKPRTAPAKPPKTPLTAVKDQGGTSVAAGVEAERIEPGASGSRRTECLLGRKQFLGKAGPLVIRIGGKEMEQYVEAEAREFKPSEASPDGSFGWHTNGKIVVIVDGVPATVMVSGSIIVVGSGGGKSKAKCTISRQEFLAKATALQVGIGDKGAAVVGGVKEFKPNGEARHGSFGWYGQGKATVKFGDAELTLQVGLNLTVVGSKHVVL